MKMQKKIEDTFVISGYILNPSVARVSGIDYFKSIIIIKLEAVLSFREWPRLYVVMQVHTHKQGISAKITSVEGSRPDIKLRK